MAEGETHGMWARAMTQVRTSTESAKVQGGTCSPINSWNQVLGQEGEKYIKKGTERQVFRVESEAALLLQEGRGIQEAESRTLRQSLEEAAGSTRTIIKGSRASARHRATHPEAPSLAETHSLAT